MKVSSIEHNRRSPVFFTAAVFACALAFTAPPSPFVATAHAQSDTDIEQAKKRYGVGKEHYEQEEYLKAAGAFYEAYELSGEPKILYMIGKAYQKANRLKKAETFLQRYLNELPDADNADRVVELIIQIQEEMAAQMASVEVEASRQGVRIFVDEDAEPRCQTPCTVSILPGTHTLTARPEGMEPIVRTVEVKAEQQTQVNFELPGSLQLSTDQRSGTVTVAGVGEYSLPLSEPIALSPGRHKVTVEGDDARWSGEVDVAGGEITRILVPLGGVEGGSGGTSTLRTVSYSLLGASAGFLVGGIVLGMQASDTHAALESQQSALGSVNTQMVEQGQSQQFGANLMYTLSAATLASGAGLFAWDLYGGGSSAEEEIPPSTETSADGAKSGGDLLGVGTKSDDEASTDQSSASKEKQKGEGADLF